VRKRELTEAKRAPVMGLDKRYPRIVDERSEQAGDEVRAEVLGVGVKEANDLASEHWQRPPQGVALAEHLPELWSQLALCMDLCPKLACDLGRAVNGVVNYHDLVDQPELAQLSEAAEDGPNRAHLVASRQADGHRTHLRGAQPRRECGRGAELAVVKGIALVPAQGAHRHEHSMTEPWRRRQPPAERGSGQLPTRMSLSGADLLGRRGRRRRRRSR